MESKIKNIISPSNTQEEFRKIRQKASKTRKENADANYFSKIKIGTKINKIDDKKINTLVDKEVCNPNDLSGDSFTDIKVDYNKKKCSKVYNEDLVDLKKTNQTIMKTKNKI